MKQFRQNDMRFDTKELKTDLGQGNFIFVGSSCDMWSEPVWIDWIEDTLDWCGRFDNKYLFQSKNPDRFRNFLDLFPEKTYLGTTIETNRTYPEMGNAPPPEDRSDSLHYRSYRFPTMVTVEPIMDFDVEELVSLITFCNPQWVNIGADSKDHGLPEPSAENICDLIEKINEKNIMVKLKDNLKRLMWEE
jgi:hypothetical protein